MYKDKDKQREYQRNWVRQKRAKGSTNVIPSDTTSVEPDTGYQRNYEIQEPEPQSTNPMKVGYVPPVE
ncbi:MAG: hypothetical protein ACYSTS_19685 [Planctomycetota bacterium]|jgi:hypothetical protein